MKKTTEYLTALKTILIGKIVYGKGEDIGIGYYYFIAFTNKNNTAEYIEIKYYVGKKYKKKLEMYFEV